MLRNVDGAEWKNGSIEVTLEDGTIYKNCDYPNSLFSDTTPSIVSFWHDGKLYNIPIDLIKLPTFF